MGRSVENPKKYIVSCRVSDEELQILQTLARQNGENISSLLRQSLTMLNATPEKKDLS